MASETPVPSRPTAQTSQKSGAKPAWLNGEGEPVGEFLKIPEDRPDLVVFIKTQAGYAKAMQMNKDGEALFGTGEASAEFTEILSGAISKKINVTCAPPEEDESTTNTNLETSQLVRTYIQKQKDFESAATKLLIVSFGSVLVAILANLIISKMRSRGS